MPPRVAPNDGQYKVKILNSGTSVVNLLGTAHCTAPSGFKVHLDESKNPVALQQRHVGWLRDTLVATQKRLHAILQPAESAHANPLLLVQC